MDPIGHPGTDDHSSVRRESEPTTLTPRWVRITAITALVLAIAAFTLSLLITIMLFTRGASGPSLWNH
jgi:hypothetical protein